MKAVAFVLLLAICSIYCRKVVPIDKQVNTNFINMEMGGGAPVAPSRPTPASVKPQSSQPQAPTKPSTPVLTTTKPITVAAPTIPPPAQIKPVIPKPVQPLPNQSGLKPVPAYAPASGGITTPGPGSVKQLVTFYDSKGQASVIRPYSYSDAVKRPGKAQA